MDEIKKSLKIGNKSRREKIYSEEAIRLDAQKNKKPCVKCGRFIDGAMTVDHIVPDSILGQLGVDVAVEIDNDNTQLMCRPCNQYKANRLDFTNPKTKEILLKYINKL